MWTVAGVAAAAGLTDGVMSGDLAASFELGRGAIAGAFIVASAFLAGYAAIRRSGLALCALLVVLGAGAMELSWMGFLPSFSGEIVVLMQALFVAALIVFLSASVSAARYNPILGGVMFTAALIIGGMGLINFFDRIDLAPVMRFSMFAVGGFAVVLAVTQAVRGDMGARLILPGLGIAALAPFVGPLGVADASSFSLLPHGLFTLGILAASLVSLTEGASPQMMAPAGDFGVSTHSGFAAELQHDRHQHVHSSRERDEVVLDSQIARVLDYSGVAIWDWAPNKIDQTESLPRLMGADSDAPFTPEALRDFVHKDDISKFEREVLAPVDGPFDVGLKLFDGRLVRIRGARAADEEAGVLERLVAFVESAKDGFAPAKGNGVDGARVMKATEAAIVPPTTGLMAVKLTQALEKGDIVAAFQPIVSFEDGKIAGYEALARWRDQTDGADEGPETFVKAAEVAGKGGLLAATMLEQACAHLAERIKKEKRDDLFVAMNVSWKQISKPEFADAVSEAIKKYSLPKNALVLELTEADAVTDTTLAGDVFSKLKKAGASLAFDDFGAGFTCLSNLRKYNFDYLKIDKSFAADLEGGGDGAKIASAMAALGKELGLKVIIEGVETKKAADAAEKLGFAYGQGFAFGKPAGATRAVNKKKVLEKLANLSVDSQHKDPDEIELTSDMIDAGADEEQKKNGRWRFFGGDAH